MQNERFCYRCFFCRFKFIIKVLHGLKIACFFSSNSRPIRRMRLMKRRGWRNAMSNYCSMRTFWYLRMSLWVQEIEKGQNGTFLPDTFDEIQIDLDVDAFNLEFHLVPNRFERFERRAKLSLKFQMRIISIVRQKERKQQKKVFNSAFNNESFSSRLIKHHIAVSAST